MGILLVPQGTLILERQIAPKEDSAFQTLTVRRHVFSPHELYSVATLPERQISMCTCIVVGLYTHTTTSFLWSSCGVLDDVYVSCVLGNLAWA